MSGAVRSGPWNAGGLGAHAGRQGGSRKAATSRKPFGRAQSSRRSRARHASGERGFRMCTRAVCCRDFPGMPASVAGPAPHRRLVPIRSRCCAKCSADRRRLSSWLSHCAPCGERREGERDRHRAEADAERADIEPAVAAGGVEDPAADGRAERHAEARDQRRPRRSRCP